MSEVQQLYKRYSDAKGNWETWRPLYDEAYAFTNADRDPWPEQVAEGQKKNTQVYDLTATNSSRRLVSQLHKNLTPLGESWFSLEAGDLIVDPEAKKNLNLYLQAFTDILNKVINDSNFDLSVNEFYQDLIIGTAAMMVMESDDPHCPIICKAVTPNTIFPEGNAYDQIETVWREFNETYIRDIKRLWPKAKLTRKMEDCLKNDQNAKVNLIEGVIFEYASKKWRIVVMSQDQDDLLLDLKNQKSTPWIVARWSKASREVGGRGPVIQALPTIRSSNVLTEIIIRNAGLSTSPPLMAASDGVFNPYNFVIEPNKIIPISRQSMGEVPLVKLDIAGDLNLGGLELQDMRAQIKDCLFDNPLPPSDQPDHTATEYNIRLQAFLEEIGPAFGRLAVEFLPVFINRVIFICQKKGVLPKELNVDNKNIVVRYRSPLMRSAELQKVHNLQNYASIMQSMAGSELTLASMEVESLPQWLADKLDVDETMVKSAAKIQMQAQQLQQAQQPPSPGDNVPPPGAAMVNQVQQRQAGL